jgi:putative salt-induced outer membrane protein YdiY
MKKQILMTWVLAVLTVPGRASNLDPAAVLPGNSPAEYNNNALSLLATATSDNQTTQGTIASAAVSASIETNKPVWESRIALGLTATAGNSDSALATGNFQTHKKTPWDEWALGLEGTYGEVSSVKNNEILHGFVQYNHLFSNRWYGYARADALHDGIAGVTYRFTFSPGAGYYFIKDPETSLAGELGPAILYEKLDNTYHMYPTLRLAERFEHKFDGHARLWQNVEFLPPFTSPRDFLVNAEIGVETPLTKYFSLQTYVQDNYANHPAPGLKANDVKLVSALAIKF